MACSVVSIEAIIMKLDKDGLRTIMKFDVGADGFMKMIGVLAVSALLTLIIGAFFLNLVMNELKKLS